MWPSSARSSRGTSCWPRAGRTSGSCARRCSTSASRELVALPDELHPDVAKALRARGVDSLWSHQAEAFEAAFERRRSSPPAPRRASRCASSCRRWTCSRATRAPARCSSIRPRRSRRTRRARCTRSASSARGRRSTTATRRASSAPTCAGAPTSCSPTRTCCTSGSSRTTRRGRDFFKNLAVVVIDEAHVYRGVFGSHVANVLRRLRRVCEIHGTVAALPAGQRHGRQPGRAGLAADRARRRARDLARRLAGHQAHDRDVEPAGDRRGDDGAPARRWPRPPTCSPRS